MFGVYNYRPGILDKYFYRHLVNATSRGVFLPECVANSVVNIYAWSWINMVMKKIIQELFNFVLYLISYVFDLSSTEKSLFFYVVFCVLMFAYWSSLSLSAIWRYFLNMSLNVPLVSFASHVDNTRVWRTQLLTSYLSVAYSEYLMKVSNTKKHCALVTLNSKMYKWTKIKTTYKTNKGIMQANIDIFLFFSNCVGLYNCLLA